MTYRRQDRPAAPRTVLIDTDPGLDDAVALALAFRSPELRVAGLTAVTGNLGSAQAAANALRVLDLLGAPPVPVAVGQSLPFSGHYPVDPFSHGPDGLAGAYLPASVREVDERSAAQLVVDTVNDHCGDIVVCLLGPMTNLAAALELDPELPRKVTRVTAIAGAFGVNSYAWSQATGGNPVSEWNMFVDPIAARSVFRAGFNLALIGLDITTHPDMNPAPDQLQRLLTARTREAEFLINAVDFVTGRGYQPYCAFIDSAAVASLVDADLVGFEDVRCDVSVDDPLTAGMTVVERRAHHADHSLPIVRVATQFDYPGFRALVIDRLATRPHPGSQSVATRRR